MSNIRFTHLPEELKQADDFWAWRMIGRTWLTIALVMLACSMSSSPVIWIIGFVVIGHMQYHFSVVGHHALHKNLLSSVAVNEFASRYLIYGPLGLPNDAMRHNHMMHHTHFEREGDYELDNYDLSRFGRSNPEGLSRWMVGVFVGGGILAALKRVISGSEKLGSRKNESSRGILADWGPVVICQCILLASWWLATGLWWSYFLMWLAPIFTILTGFSATRAMLEHADTSQPPRRLMTFPTGWIERYVIGPCNFNFHAEHHLHPGVPACHLERLHYYLRDNNALDGVVLVSSYRQRIRSLFQQLSSHPTILPVS